LTYDLDLQSQASQGQGRPSCQKSRSKVKQFKQESVHTKRTNTHTHGHYQTYYLPCYAVDKQKYNKQCTALIRILPATIIIGTEKIAWPARVSLTNGAGCSLSRRFSPAQFSHNQHLNINDDNITKNNVTLCTTAADNSCNLASDVKTDNVKLCSLLSLLENWYIATLLQCTSLLCEFGYNAQTAQILTFQN